MKVYVWGQYRHAPNRAHYRQYEGVTMSLQEAANEWYVIGLDGNNGWVVEHDILTGTTRDLKFWQNPEFYEVMDRAKRETQYAKIDDTRPDRV